MSARSRVVTTSLFLFMVIATCAICYPFALIALTAVKSQADLVSNSFGLPSSIAWSNFALVFQQAQIPTATAYSALITGLAIAGQLFLGSLAAYALARMRIAWPSLFLTLFLLPMTLSVQGVIVPLYLLFKYLHLINTLPGVVLIYIGLGMPLSVFVLTKFMQGIPKEISESAFVDGANHFRIYRSIILPLVKPALATVIIVNGLSVWNDFFIPYLFLTSGAVTTLPLSVFNFIRQYSSQPNLIAADILYAVLPAVVAYLLLQRFIIGGAAEGALKG
jgi:raffinose/stachyose/melibiose transport system permease protein